MLTVGSGREKISYHYLRDKKNKNIRAEGSSILFFPRLWLSKDFDTLSLSLSLFRLFVYLFACFASFVEKKSKVE